MPHIYYHGIDFGDVLLWFDQLVRDFKATPQKLVEIMLRLEAEHPEWEG